MEKTKSLAVCGITCALTLVLTVFTRIPIGTTGEIIHIGDSIMLIATLTFGLTAGLAGAAGSFLSDLFMPGGVPWSIPTLLIKSAMVAFAYVITRRIENKFLSQMYVHTGIAIILLTGYFFATWLILGTAWAALPGIFFNLLQSISTSVITVIVRKYVVRV